MAAPDDAQVRRAVELQKKSYELLQWVATAGSEADGDGPVRATA